MLHSHSADLFPPEARIVSPMILSDRLISLAKDADRAGYRGSASLLVTLAHLVFDEWPAASQH